LNKAEQTMNELGAQRRPFLFILDFELNKPFVIPLNEVNNYDIKFKFGEIKNYKISRSKILPKLVFERIPIDYINYKEAFDFVMGQLKYGNSFLTNLTFPTEIHTNYTLNDIFYTSRAKYKLFFKNEFVVFSPETFVNINNGIIISYPMKGTIEANVPNAENKLMEDEKEIAEHYTIVDLIRNDLSLVAKKVKVKKFRFLETIKTNTKTLLQTSTEIEGVLPDDFHANIGNIIFSLLPAGSISGAPKKKTVEIIREAEKQDRGYYTGVMGIFDGKNLDSAVMIRYIEKKDQKLVYRSGCGITAQSDCMTEFQEMIDKVYVPIG